MQEIILCPKCHVRVKKDNLGELLCPSCNARLCPKAHIFNVKICPYCGWEDPNYDLWQKDQKAQAERALSKKSQESFDSKPQYICPRCQTQVNIPLGVCPNQRGCGYSGPMQRIGIQEPATSATPAPMSRATDTTPRRYKSAPSASRQPSIPPPRSPILDEIAEDERREGSILRRQAWRLTGISAAAVLIIVVIIAFSRSDMLPRIGTWFSHLATAIASNHPRASSPSPTPIPTQTYDLSISVSHKGNKIQIFDHSGNNTYDPDTPSKLPYDAGATITLTAIPDADCYTFTYWEGTTSNSLEKPSETTIRMDSDKSVTANFKLKDTTPPAISEVKVPSHSDMSATITWETDNAATSQVQYGKTKDYGLSTETGDELTNSHKVRLTALEPRTTYYFMVKSADKCGNEATKTETLSTLDKIRVGDRVGERAPDFQLPEYKDGNPESPNNGEMVKLSQFKGKKIMLNFWNTFCGACIGEFPLMRQIYEDSKNSDFVVITICIDGRIDEAPDRIKQLEEKYKDVKDTSSGEKVGNLTFRILLDIGGEAQQNYHIGSIPETVFIDSDGIIREIKIGRFNSLNEIEYILRRLD